jgi:DNA-binding cell septation regulator SpoVG
VTPRVTEVRFTPADDGLRATGLLGWASFLLDSRLKVEGVGVRRTQNGRFALAFPFRDDGYGKRWHFVYPIDDATRVALEQQVLAGLDLEGLAR